MKYVKPLNETDENAGYTDADPAHGIKGSTVPAAAIEMPQREIVAAIMAAGLVPSGEDGGQLAQAIANQIAAAVALLIPRSMVQEVSILPVNPDPDVFYYTFEEKKTTDDNT